MSSNAKEETEYWLISVPNNKPTDEKEAPEELRIKVESKQGEFKNLSKLPITKLRVGTLDKLISLSDELGRVDRMGQSLVVKLDKTWSDLEQTDQQLTVYTKPVHSYILGFEWDEGHFNLQQPLKDLAAGIQNNLSKTAEHLRKWTQGLTETQNQLQVISKKKSGSLLTKSLKQYVVPQDWKDGEYLRSALVVVPTSKEDDFKESYDHLEESEENEKWKRRMVEQQHHLQHQKKDKVEIKESEKDTKADEKNVKPDEKNAKPDEKNKSDEKKSDENNVKSDQNATQIDNSNIESLFATLLQTHDCRTVVPESAHKLQGDQEFVLYQVLVLRKGYDWFKNVCKEKGFTVRDFSASEFSEEDEKKETELKTKEDSEKKKLKLYCQSTFSDTFANWIHLKVIKAFVESVLRFGLPVDFSISVVKPVKGNEKKLLKYLESQYSHLVEDKYKASTQENEIDYSGLSQEFYPFVYVPIKVEF